MEPCAAQVGTVQGHMMADVPETTEMVQVQILKVPAI